MDEDAELEGNPNHAVRDGKKGGKSKKDNQRSKIWKSNKNEEEKAGGGVGGDDQYDEEA